MALMIWKRDPSTPIGRSPARSEQAGQISFIGYLVNRMTPTPGVFVDLLILKEFKFNDLELQILQGIWADFLELRITKELERQFTVDSLRLKARRGKRDAGEGFRTGDWRNTGKDSRYVTLFQVITEWYSNGLWKSVRMLRFAAENERPER